MMNQQIQAILNEALLCSLCIAPDAPGLSSDEAFEIARRFDYFDGEIGDAARGVLNNYEGNKYIPSENHFIFMLMGPQEDPSLLNYKASDFIFEQLNLIVRQMGAGVAGIDRATLIARGLTKGFKEIEIKSTVLILKYGNILREDNGLISYKDKSGVKTPLGQQSTNHRQKIAKPLRAKVYDIVQDVIKRRCDGRPAQVEALDAFADALSQMGQDHFRMWWTQMAGELRRLDASHFPVSYLVLAAALSEGALTFAAKYARHRQLDAFGSNNFAGEPKTWRMDKLIEAAAFGGPQAILDGPAKTAIERLHLTRQRIHAGRMLSDHPGGLPDLRPEEARSAKEAAEQTARAVLDWLGRPPA